MEQEFICNNPNSKEELEKKLLQEKLDTLIKINEEYQKYLDALKEENSKKKAYIDEVDNRNTQ